MEGSASIYEVNTRLRLPPRGARALVDFGVRDEEIDAWARAGFEYIWMMGVWQVGEQARRRALEHARRNKAFEEVAPGWREEDLEGSPYAIAAYEPDERLGGREGLARLRARLAERGLGLILDFVPNHVGLDHPWREAHPEYFIALEGEGGDGRLAHGRDPYFPPWDDTLQLDYGCAATRAAMSAELEGVAAQCDGVRCDMAMLVLNEVRRRTWGELSREDPGCAEREFWQEAIARVRAAHPGFLFVAEAYWGLAGALHECGFDLCYDKDLYDVLLAGEPEAIRAAVDRPPAHQERLLHFLENHDERRAAEALDRRRHGAAAALCYTLAGARLFHEGQLEGRRARLPVQLRRAPAEPLDEEVRALYGGVLAALRTPMVRRGCFQVLAPVLLDGEGPAVAHQWQLEDGRRAVVAANLGAQPLRLRLPAVAPGAGAARDLLGGESSEVPAVEGGHEVALGPWRACILAP